MARRAPGSGNSIDDGKGKSALCIRRRRARDDSGGAPRPRDYAKTLALAAEAISVCRVRGSRLWEFSALLTQSRALRELHGAQATKEIEAALTEAAAWLEMSGAKSYEPFVHVERAELARLTGDEASRERELNEAHRLFTEIGAPIRAAAVAKELGL